MGRGGFQKSDGIRSRRGRSWTEGGEHPFHKKIYLRNYVEASEVKKCCRVDPGGFSLLSPPGKEGGS